MKKLVSLFIITLLCLAMAPMHVFASESDMHVDEPKGHTHVFLMENTITKPIGYVPHNEPCHKMQYRNECKCSGCNVVSVWLSYGTPVNHDGIHGIDAASCDGIWQKHFGTCSSCGGYGYKRVRCPAGPHTGLCPALPV